MNKKLKNKEMVIQHYGFPEKITIAKDETVNLFMLISMENENAVPFNILLDYWDVEKRAYYNYSEEFEVFVDGTHQTIEPKEHMLQTEIENS